MSEQNEPGIVLTAEQKRRRRARSIAIALSLGVLVAAVLCRHLVKGPGVLDPAAVTDMTEIDPRPASRTDPLRRRDIIVAAACGAVRRRDGRRGLCRGAALRLVLPRHRLQRHDAGRDVRRRAACSTARSRCASTPTSARACPGASSPSRTRSRCKLGEVVTVDYIVINEAAREITASAAYNVAPLNDWAPISRRSTASASPSRRLKAGEKRDMPVVFYVDPAMAKDPDGADHQHHHAVLHFLSAARAAAAGGGQRSGQRPGD